MDVEGQDAGAVLGGLVLVLHHHAARVPRGGDVVGAAVDIV